MIVPKSGLVSNDKLNRIKHKQITYILLAMLSLKHIGKWSLNDQAIDYTTILLPNFYDWDD